MTRNGYPELNIDKSGADGEPQATMMGESSQYSEKFHALREKLDHVTAIHRDHENALEAAQSKLKNLQAECDMLLDTIAAHASSQPSLMQYLDHLDNPPSYTSAPPHGIAPENTPPVTMVPSKGVSPRAHPVHHPALANGHAHEPERQHVSRHDAR